VVYDPRVSAIHLVGQSQNSRSWRENRYLHYSRLIYFRKHYGLFPALLAAWIIGFGLALRGLGEWVRSKRIVKRRERRKDS
jgi:GT2 family glycosyltransferase